MELPSQFAALGKLPWFPEKSGGYIIMKNTVPECEKHSKSMTIEICQR